MNRTLWLIMAVLVLGLTSACLAAGGGTAAIKATQPGSKLAGTAVFTETPNGLRILATITHAPPGTHGFHIHENGSCSDGGKAAGGHFNPDHHPHGDAVKHGLTKAHAGDLGNITIGPNGSGTLKATVKGLTLSQGPHAVAGKAVILHEKADDFGQPTGNAGGRIGCGIIRVESGR